MTHKSATISSFDAYLAIRYDTANERLENKNLRKTFLARFPHSVMIELAYAERDYANRWCWQKFGSSDGKCHQQHSEYRVCLKDSAHLHDGIWTDHWYLKTDYDFGFNEWFFANESDQKEFLDFAPSITWGENYPKQ